VWSSLWAVKHTADAISLGYPIANTQLYVLDGRLRPVPIGVIGEVYIGGAGLARGYLKRAELTAERFIPNPFAVEPGERLYRTGDLAYFRAYGRLTYVGRLDHQVKIRGYRIELGEIAAVLCEHPAIQDAVVLAQGSAPSGMRLIAYSVIIPQPPKPKQETIGDGPSQQLMRELSKFLRSKLPDYMVPASIVFLDNLPRMPNGKVDRKALPVPDGKRPESEGAFIAPRTPLEEEIARIFAAVLGMERVGIDDSFFDLGGHSLLAARLVAELHATYHVHMSLRTSAL
jgi:acyl-coenzyme A synthetase/AMP-(fatty) acid ligase/acyl carrier protein